MPPPLVSVVVTTRNEAKRIVDCLASVQQQTYPADRRELIVVDNASTDETKVLARKYTPMVYDGGPERSAQRNMGILRKARGSIVVFLDADMRLSPGVLSACVEYFAKNPATVGLYIPEMILGNGWWGRVRNFERSFYTGTSIDCVRCVRTDVFRAVGGFDETLTGPEDWDFDKRMRREGLVGVIDQPLFHDERDVTLWSYVRKKAYYAASFDRYRDKWGKDDKDIRRQFGLWYRYAWVFVERGKWRRFLPHPLRASALFGVRLLVGICFLTRR